MRELAKKGHKVLVVAAEEMSEDRRSLGWDIPSLEPAQVIICSAVREVEKIVKESPQDAIHLIAGARAVPLGAVVATCCRIFGRRIGIITEAPDPRGLGGLLRWLKYSWERFFEGKHFEFILAMGEKGVTWFKRCGYPHSIIFPFAYVVESSSSMATMAGDTTFRFVFVGQLIHLKGLDLLLEALSEVPGVELVVIGDGPERRSLQALAKALGIDDRVHWLGKMLATQVPLHIVKADVLVLPSRQDGWGAVVNEALMVGTPVICSSACGAADLIRYPWLGTVFRKNDVNSLRSALVQWGRKSLISCEHRQRVRSWAKCIEGANVGQYLEAVLLHVYKGNSRPQPPWRV